MQSKKAGIIASPAYPFPNTDAIAPIMIAAHKAAL
jgi:hypothetical protein